MIRAPRFRVGALLALLAIPGIASAWSGVQHIQITRYAARNLPPEMAGFREFAHPMALPSIYPDLWRLADLDEAPRHYFEPDRLPEDFDYTALSSDPAIAFSEQIPIRRDIIGDAPWAIYDLMNQMSEAMRTNDWMWAARCGATLSHYAGDLHVPLHTTRNYNGQESWQHGIHTRWEADMVKAFLRTDDIEPRPAEYLENPFQAIFEWTAESAVCAREVLKADLIAKRAADYRANDRTRAVVAARVVATIDIGFVTFLAWSAVDDRVIDRIHPQYVSPGDARVVDRAVVLITAILRVGRQGHAGE